MLQELASILNVESEDTPALNDYVVALKLPSDISQVQLSDYFAKYGQIAKIITKKDGALTLVLIKDALPAISELLTSKRVVINEQSIKIVCKQHLPAVQRTTVFIGNLPSNSTSTDIEALLNPCGEIEYVTVHKAESDSETSNSYAYVKFSEHSEMIKATKMNGVQLLGRELRITATNDNSKVASKQQKKQFSKDRKDERRNRIKVHIVNEIEDEFMLLNDKKEEFPLVNMKKVNKEGKKKLFTFLHISPKKALSKSTKLFRRLHINEKKIRNQRRETKRKSNLLKCKKIKILKK